MEPAVRTGRGHGPVWGREVRVSPTPRDVTGHRAVFSYKNPGRCPVTVTFGRPSNSPGGSYF